MDFSDAAFRSRGRGVTASDQSKPPRKLCFRNNRAGADRKSTRLNSSHMSISYAVFCLKKKKHVRLHLRLGRRRPPALPLVVGHADLPPSAGRPQLALPKPLPAHLVSLYAGESGADPHT